MALHRLVLRNQRPEEENVEEHCVRSSPVPAQNSHPGLQDEFQVALEREELVLQLFLLCPPPPPPPPPRLVLKFRYQARSLIKQQAPQLSPQQDVAKKSARQGKSKIRRP